MEDVLAVYQRPYNPLHPTVCMDETSKQLVGELVQALPLQVGQPACYDYEYVRNGVNNLFMFFEPLAGQRFVKVTAHRTKVDWAQAIRDLVDLHYPLDAVIFGKPPAFLRFTTWFFLIKSTA